MSQEKIATWLLDEMWDAGFKLSGPECDKVDEIGRRIEGENAVLLGLLTDCAAILRTIDPDDSDDAEKLAGLLGAIDRAQAPTRHQGALL
jgi:hypothetical protein